MKKIIIRESQKKYLMESNGMNIDEVDISSFMAVANRYESYASQIKQFIEEYKTFYKVLISTVNKLGLVCINQENDDGFFENPNEGVVYKYIFTDGQDPRELYDNDAAYEAHMRKMEELGSNLEVEINPRAFHFCQVRVNYNEEITVTLSFGLYE
jgi:hypothetical protein